MKLILWDIDGTLLRGGSAAAEAYQQALRATYRIEGELARISYGGKTDSQIALELVSHHAISSAEAIALLDSFRETYTRELERQRARVERELRVLPGVRAVLALLAEQGTVQSVLTGNYAATASLKLRCAGLAHYLDLEAGAFGSDHHDRNCLVPIALERAQRRYGRPYSAEQTVVIGDTPRDIDCARAGGARAVAVASGDFSLEELQRCSPDALLNSLEDAQSALAAILGS